MRKPVVDLTLLCLVVSLLISCANKTDDAIRLATEYKRAQFDVSHYDYAGNATPEVVGQAREVMAPFLTDKYLDYQTRNRTLILPVQLSNKLKAAPALDDLTFSVFSKEEGRVELDYGVNVTFQNENVGDAKALKMEGRITLVKEGGAWKVDYDNFNAADWFGALLE
ncbi:hypothetical protein PAE9249_00526 [Paenibacillus sp. CECT 9249]|uniref:hypothetical protein n=1 Tax=Paenibacillus sp. CECT 9249 TaxID=2845385 RepID=UPI001E29B9EB|nr:hypothetical protein [Paenibacillus sp. CECT 9249]CAH0118061.1 hypothetical protein PAE9249_00526 [Paenibacillus sp. CECT 9249]